MFNEILSERISSAFKARRVVFETKKMFGGVCFMVDDKMCVGINKGEMMVRLDPAVYDDVLKKEGVREMDFTKRPMKGFVFVADHALETDDRLEFWIGLALDYNPKAKSSKKKKK